MGWFWLVLIVPFLTPFIMKLAFPKQISWLEMGVQFFIVSGIVAAIFAGGRYSETHDREVWNGQVVDKKRVEVSCEHSYDCNCYTSCSGSGSNRSCTEYCSTCYDHSFDVDWRIYTNLARNFNVYRVDRQGLETPPDWTKIEIGDPVSEVHSYVNWVKGAPDSLFSFTEIPAENLPEYPLRVYDYIKLDRVLVAGDISIPDLNQWNKDLAEELIWIGPNKQANIIIVFTDDVTPMFADALRSKWLGGKKNDIVIVVGISSWPAISWVKAFSWSKNDMVNVVLRDKLLDLEEVERDKFIEIVRLTVFEDYIRRPMKEFEYLKDDIEPPTWLIVLCLVLGIGGSIGVSFVFYKHDFNLNS